MYFETVCPYVASDSPQCYVRVISLSIRILGLHQSKAWLIGPTDAQQSSWDVFTSLGHPMRAIPMQVTAVLVRSAGVQPRVDLIESGLAACVGLRFHLHAGEVIV
jgi:hypothetical protein